jgi:hypothetical protein
MTMESIIHLGFAIVLLLVTLGLALSFLSGPIGLLKKTGALGAGRWAVRSTGRGVAGLFRLLLRRRRPRFRRLGSRPPTGYFR